MPDQRLSCLSRRHLLAAAALACVPAIGPARGECGPPEAAWTASPELLADLPRLMQALAVPGLAIATVEQGQIAWTHHAGVRRTGFPHPVDSRTLFEAASLSKPVFAYLVLQLVDAGVLALDRPLVHYLRPEYLSDSPLLERITVRDVLRHSTGLPNWREHPATEKLSPLVAPGARIDYSGEAFQWLQFAVERVTGQSLDTLAHQRLFSRAGMNDSSFTWNADLAARSVYGHSGPNGEPAQPRQLFRDIWSAAQQVADHQGKPLSQWTYSDAAAALDAVARLAPPERVNWPGDCVANAAASLRCTAADYARFVSLCLHRPHRAEWELQEATRAAMLSPQLRVPGRWAEKTLGWNLEATRVGPLFFHSGSNGGIFKTFAMGDALRRRGIVVFTNGGGGHLLYRRIVRDATGLDLLAFDV